MWRNIVAMLALCVLLGLAGCGNPSASTQTANQQTQDESARPAPEPTAETPEGAVAIFLDAVCAGDDERAANMLTDLARRKTAEMDLEVAPPGSDTAQFRLGEVEILGETGARVACIWSDLDEEGERTEEQILWVLRREDVGWRIAGMAPTIFPGEPPLLLNFENPEEMIEKLEWVREEAMRRAQAELLPGNPGTTLEARGSDLPRDETRR